MSLEGKITEGSKVWVVYGKKLSNGSEAIVTQVAKKYGYLEVSGSRTVIRFELATGLSTHGNDSNAHANGRGYEVFPSKDDANNVYDEREARDKLRSRLSSSVWMKVSKMPLEMVNRWNEDFDLLDGQGNQCE